MRWPGQEQQDAGNEGKYRTAEERGVQVNGREKEEGMEEGWR